MTWPFENDTSAITKKLALKSIKADRQRRKVKDFFIKFTKKPQKKCQKQILAPDTFADGLFAPA